MGKSKGDGEAEYASQHDVEEAVGALSPVDELRLERFARYKIRGLGRKAMNRDHEDLLREAISSTWIGAGSSSEGRRWKKRIVAFPQHLIGAMRSIASHWKESFDDCEALLDSDLATEQEDGETQRPIENAASQAADPERSLAAKEQLASVFKLFAQDNDAALVIEGIREGWTGPEIIERLALPKNRYEAALKRIRYHVK